MYKWVHLRRSRESLFWNRERARHSVVSIRYWRVRCHRHCYQRNTNSRNHNYDRCSCNLRKKKGSIQNGKGLWLGRSRKYFFYIFYLFSSLWKIYLTSDLNECNRGNTFIAQENQLFFVLKMYVYRSVIFSPKRELHLRPKCFRFYDIADTFLLLKVFCRLSTLPINSKM